MLFNIRPLRDVPSVRREIIRLLEKQKPGTWDDLSSFRKEIEELLSSISEFVPSWGRARVVFRIARVQVGGETRAFLDNVELPNTKHDFDLVLKMMNHLRKEKGLEEVKMPLFVQPDDMALARKDGLLDFEPDKILSQLAIVFQKGTIIMVGFVFGRDYVLLEN